MYVPKRQPDSYQFIGSNRCLNCAVCDANYRIQTVILYAESLAIRLVNFRLLTLYWLSMYVVHLYLLLEVLIILILFFIISYRYKYEGIINNISMNIIKVLFFVILTRH